MRRLKRKSNVKSAGSSKQCCNWPPLLLILLVILGIGLIAGIQKSLKDNAQHISGEGFVKGLESDSEVVDSIEKATSGSSTVPSFRLTWEVCINLPGSIILQTYPRICDAPDGRRAIEPTSTTITIIPTVILDNAVSGSQPETPLVTTSVTNATYLSWEDCINTPGSRILQTYPVQCVTPDGNKVTEETYALPTATGAKPKISVVDTISTFIGNLFSIPVRFFSNLFSSK
ncbi:hypothetical protein MUP32_02645 [Candidatus Microgenomates bacterium]|nr:hypothetical protein [Candidatus Microgenomates bacterium]